MKRIRVNRLPRLLLGLACLLALDACTDPDAASSESAKTNRHAIFGAPTNLDPAQAGTTQANFVVVNLFDTLYRYKYLARPYEITPNLAAGMPEVSDHGLSYTFRIHNFSRGWRGACRRAPLPAKSTTTRLDGWARSLHLEAIHLL